jgi:RNA polymerase sigma-70 factor (ECF subfamily)
MSGAQQLRLASLHDVELATLAATGDRRAFGELVRRHGSGVRGLLRRMGAPIADYRGEGAFAGWVKRIAARQYLRRLQREKRLAALAIEAEGEAHEPAVQTEAAGRIDLDEALKSLGAPERLCVTMCYGAGLSHGEAAEALNLPLGTVKSHVKRGLEKLRTRLAPPDGASLEGSRANG